MALLDNILSGLPEYFKNGQLVKERAKILSEFLIELEGIFNQILESIDLDTATGYLLDIKGVNVNEFREGDDDAAFRLRIRQKIISGYSLSDIETINSYALSVLGDAFLSCYVDAEYGGDPATLVVKHEPTVINVPEVVKAAVAGGIEVKDTTRVYSKVAGFAIAGFDGVQPYVVTEV